MTEETYIPSVYEIENTPHKKVNLARSGISWPPNIGWKLDLVANGRSRISAEQVLKRNELIATVAQSRARYERQIRKPVIVHYAEMCRAQGQTLRNDWLEVGLDALARLWLVMKEAQVHEDEEAAFVAEYLRDVLLRDDDNG